jgi:hypothetical protein
MRSLYNSDDEEAFDHDQLAELAASGGICEECGGVHAASVEVMIIAINSSTRDRSLKIPFCTCPSCLICQPLRHALDAVAAKVEKKT